MHNSTIFYYQAKIQYVNQVCPETIQLESYVYEWHIKQEYALWGN
jgi:hypothetical protein